MISNDPYDIYENLVEETVFNGIPLIQPALDDWNHNVYQLILGFYNKGLSSVDAAINLMKVLAMDYWTYFAASDFATTESDYAVNGLLSDVSGDKYCDDFLSDSIYDTIQKLDYDELRSFLKGCGKLEAMLL